VTAKVKQSDCHQAVMQIQRTQDESQRERDARRAVIGVAAKRMRMKTV
jgi:hypothetical protein